MTNIDLFKKFHLTITPTFINTFKRAFDCGWTFPTKRLHYIFTPTFGIPKFTSHFPPNIYVPQWPPKMDCPTSSPFEIYTSRLIPAFTIQYLHPTSNNDLFTPHINYHSIFTHHKDPPHQKKNNTPTKTTFVCAHLLRSHNNNNRNNNKNNNNSVDESVLSRAPPWSSGSVLDHRSLPPVFESRRGPIWTLFRLSLRLITFGGRSAHLAYLVHKSSRKTSIINHHHHHLRPIINNRLSHILLYLIMFFRFQTNNYHQIRNWAYLSQYSIIIK